MPRHNPASSTTRNHRISNKTRLKVIRGDIESDGIIPADEDEKDRWQQNVSGVDNKEVNEHHLQLVLSEASLRSSSSGSGKEDKVSYIPTPDSNGVVSNHEVLYPSNRWKDPQSYVHSSLTVEESASAALSGGFTYLMDERDKEWLDKNNEEARGEGTSASVKRSSSPSSSSAKGKGKETEEQHAEPVSMSEDEFELVMGLFEKIAHENTEYLYHALANGMPFPPFSDYEPTFSSPLPPSTFAIFHSPPWVPPPHQLVSIARSVYPYWKERRLERSGHRIVPILNFDEEDTLNESYVCFRRLETKALRKTRVQQVSYADKLVRLQSELGSALDLAKAVLLREQTKLENMTQSKAVWGLRTDLVNLKSRNPDKEDEALLFDKERVAKKKKSEASAKTATKSERSQTPAQELRSLRSDNKTPETRAREIQQMVESIVAKQKEEDSQWENVLDAGFVNPYVPHHTKLFKSNSNLKASSPALSSSSDSDARSTRRPLRRRVGRGGRSYVDRRLTIRLPPSVPKPSRHRVLVDSDDEQSGDAEAMDVDEEVDEETDRRLAERWRFDVDDSPAVGLGGPEDQDRMLVDDYDVKYLKQSMSLLQEEDFRQLLTDPTVFKTGSDGKPEPVVPFRLGFQPPAVPMKKAPSTSSTPSSSTVQPSSMARNAATATTPSTPTPTPISMLQRHPESVPRISGNGGLPSRTTSTASSPSLPQPVQAVPSQSSSSQQQPRPVPNGIHRPAMTMPHVDASKAMSPPSQRMSTPTVNGTSNVSPDVQMQSLSGGGDTTNGTQNQLISRPQSQQSQRQAATASPHPQQQSPPHRTTTPNTTNATTNSTTPNSTPITRPVVNGHVHHPYSSSPLTASTPSSVQAYAIPYSHLSGGYGVGLPSRQMTPSLKTASSNNGLNTTVVGTNGGTPAPSATPTPNQNSTQTAHVPSSQELNVLQQLHQMQLRQASYMQNLQGLQGIQGLQGLNLQSLGTYNVQALQSLQGLQNMGVKLPIARHSHQQQGGQQQHQQGGQGQTQQQLLQLQQQHAQLVHQQPHQGVHAGGQQGVGQWVQGQVAGRATGTNLYPGNLGAGGQVSSPQQALRQQQMSSKAA
ncbi:hypothetical protein K435DRAFT_834639 [Dendrothele bispora CBS 962.96]|uniref:Enhancer of polycomb-like N-terminal domain-containing protein n=1 Tax=Dendrothele bispora (strain CBS 962.96) TaxID=1314807 RepID=A0A4V4HI98_DENBC|nr:hypothetical protein K435DRAFT_834639 [Dendrothele bispora CBS 962.96]